MIKNLIYESNTIAKVFIADNFLNRFLGFMFHKKPHYEAILFNPCNSIHTFFMKFSIDVLFINEDMEVVKKLEGIKPGKVVMPHKKSKMVIEGNEGMFKNIEEGKKLILL